MWEDMSLSEAASGARWFGCVEPIHREKHMRTERESWWLLMAGFKPHYPSPKRESTDSLLMSALV